MSVRVGDEIVAGGQGDMYTKAQVDALIASAIAQTTEKPGMIKPFAGTTIPTGYLLCDGSAVSRTTYANLFAAIGTTYGSGDGSTTFNLPDYREKTLWHNSTSTPGNVYVGRVPDIYGEIHGMFTAYSNATTLNTSDMFASGCFFSGGCWNRVTPVYQSPAWFLDGSMKLRASYYSQTYGRAHASGDDNSVIPRSLSCRFCIKY